MARPRLGSDPGRPIFPFLFVRSNHASACEDQQQLDRAVNECEALATTFPADKQSLLAQIAAGRLCLKRLNNPRRALAFYEAAASFAIPHLDWEANIRNGIEQAKQALNAPMPAA